MTSNHILPPDDDRLAALLRAAQHGAAPPDPDVLARLRESSAAAFAAAATTSPARPRGRVMFLRLCAAMTATAVATAVLLLTLIQPPKPDTKPAPKAPVLAQVLETTSSAPVLSYKLSSGGQTREIIAEKGGRWREDRADGTALVSDGDMVWRLDAQGKAVRARERRQPRDLVRLVLEGLKHDKLDLSKLEPLATEKRGDDELLVYSLGVTDNLKLEAKADVKTKELRSLIAKSGGKVITELIITTVGGEVPEEKFLVLNSLSDDGRVGKLIDSQGVVSVKPMAQSRWTPVATDFVVMPGDWLRTDARGANAAAVRLLSRSELILGPGSLVEVTKPTQIKLLEGELEINAPKGTSVELLGPDNQKVVVKGTQHYYLDRQQRLRLSAVTPSWLKGFKGTTADESLGSLVAKVDGRDVPLSVGYHKVTVDIRDQIARTTIEESFVNHTSSRLEGIFHFPLPQDASISGFGMWIGNELVEADVVEKQRAREIYEIIMAEKRDPGLLEWAGGNIFKARVWPIEGHSEKRIKITYTQVLPLKGNRYTYSYALQSEMLQQHPLRELSLTVNIASATPLKKVWSPTHNTRDQVTQHAARVEFSAQEYTPRKDLEIVIEQDHGASDVALIPHRRGADGYLLLQVMPPAAAQERAVLPDSGPMRLLILADTSASMDRKQRQQQEAFIAALVSSLTPQDTFNLACCDMTCDWAFEKPVAAEAKNLLIAREMLYKRGSLGWTDLDKAFAAVMAVADERTHVVYVGDGIPATVSADPVAFAQRLKSMYGQRGTFHAVTTGASFEPGVVKAIASLGGGSWRRIGAEQGPNAVALELLREMTQPTLRDIKVEFKGLKTARVYPTQLPNIPAGTQQILLGRYLPEGRDQEGEVIVTGTLGGKPVTMTTKVSLKDAEAGNSFIPRLWARMHLDALLEQGSSEAIRDEIIALSEEFNILTPYTSFLVLETDADRERFGVKKRFRMRDGEKFFADGRDKVDFTLVQQQMKQAGTWRLNLRRDVLRSLVGLGRNLQTIQRQEEFREKLGQLSSKSLESFDSKGSRLEGLWSMSPDLEFGVPDRLTGGFGGQQYRFREDRFSDQIDSLSSGVDLAPGSEVSSSTATREPQYEDSSTARRKDNLADEVRADAPAEADEKLLKEVARDLEGEEYYAKEEGKSKKGWDAFDPADAAMPALEVRRQQMGGLSGYAQADRDDEITRRLAASYFQYSLHADRGRYDDSLHWQRQWWKTLFPALPPSTKTVEPKPSPWPREARELAQSLLRHEALRGLKGGLELQIHWESFDARYGELTNKSQTTHLYSPKSWLTRSLSDQTQTTISWCDGNERGLMDLAFGIGRMRPATPEDLAIPFALYDHSLVSIDQTFRDYTPTIEPAGEDRVRLTMKHSDHEVQALIDTKRHVLLSLEHRTRGKVMSKQTFSDFVQAASRWWAQTVEMFNNNGERSNRMTLSVREHGSDELAAQFKQHLAAREHLLMVKYPLPRLAEARKALAEGKAGLEEQIVLMQHAASIQQWTKAREHLEAIEKLTDKPAKRWLRDAILHLSRRHEELKQRHMDEATKLAAAKMPANDAWILATRLYSLSQNFMQAAELQQLLDRLAPIYNAQPPQVHGSRALRKQRMHNLNNLGHTQEGLAILKQLATEYSRDQSLQREYAEALANSGDYSAASAWIAKSIAANPKWLEHEVGNLRNLEVHYLTTQGRTEDLLKYAEAWMATKPTSRTAYSIYLGTLYRLDREEQANVLLAQWLKEGQVRGEMAPEVAGRLSAAIYQAIGQGHNMSTHRVEERWVAPLVETAKFFAHDEQHGHYADTIMGHLSESMGDAVRQLYRQLADDLLAAAPKLAPNRIDRLMQFIGGHADADYWKKLAAVLQQRWQAETDRSLRLSLANSLLTALTHRPIDELLAFKRLRLKEADSDELRASLARSLFDSLLTTPWKQEYEDEAFSLLPTLAAGKPADEKVAPMVEGLYRLTDRMLTVRTTELNQKIERPDQLTRIELRTKQAENLKAARTAFADRLAKEVAQAPAELTAWVKMERNYLDVLLERNLAQVIADCWEILGNEPPKPAADDAEPKLSAMFEARLKERAFVTLNYLASRKNADAAQVDRLLAYIDKGIAQEGDRTAWKAAKHRLLIAVDRPKDLEAALKQWSEKGPLANYWKLHLGFLVAELGRLPEAVTLLESIRDSGELGPLAFRTMSDWYAALNQKEKHEAALREQYRQTPEHLLSRTIQQKLSPWQHGDQHLPSELDPDVLRIFAVIFEKSAHPVNYVQQLGQFYQACRDFRLLAVLADAPVGQTAMKIYPFLQGLNSVFHQIQDEAVVDQMMEQLDRTRQSAKTAVDRRALDLMEVLVRRRAAELKNQPGPHGDKALAAMQRAFDRPWAEDEQPLMANLLRSMGTIAYKPMADEQLREMKWLHAQQKQGEFHRLQVSMQYAYLVQQYGRSGEALDILLPDLNAYIAAHNGVMPAGGNEALTLLLTLFRDTKRHGEGEQFLFQRLQKPGNDEQRIFLLEQLGNHYIQAMSQGGTTTLGQGHGIYPKLEQRLRKDCAQTNPYHQYRMVQVALNLYSTARQQKIDAFAQDLRTFANQLLPELLKHHHNYYDSIVHQVAHSVYSLMGPRDAIEFVLNQVEKEPSWFRLNNQDGWSRFGGSLASWRSEVKNGLGDLEPRLLKVVLAALRRDLETTRQNNRSMYYKSYSYYWAEKEEEFVKVAEEVYKQRKNSVTSVVYIADYFYHGVGRPARAIEILYAAHAQEKLNNQQLLTLVSYLRWQSRHEEAIKLLEPLVTRWPEHLTTRIWLMNSYHNTQQQDKVVNLLKSTDEFFHQKNRWNEHVCAQLAASALENALPAQAAEYYKEAIPLRQRSAPNRGIGDGVLSEYYSNLALAYSRLNKTEEAVEAASGAVVSWPRTHHQRSIALQRLQDVLAAASDLDSFVAKLDAKEKESGMGSPVVRKAIAKAYQSKSQHAKAAAQYRAALELQPEDAESHEQLIACLDQLGDKEGAITATMESIHLSRRNLTLYKTLGERLAALQRHHDAERAYTSIVEMQPNEAESHMLLAQVRQSQSRLDEAAAHFEQAAKHRALEPTALIELARVQLALKQWDKADETLTKLEKTSWPARFDGIRSQVQQMRATWKQRR